MPTITDINMVDLTGASPGFKRNLRAFRVFKNQQVIELDEPAYADSLLVQTHDGTIYQTYSSYSAGPQDDTSVSIAKQLKFQLDSGNFTKSLIRSITITSYTSETTIYITYQALYKTPPPIPDMSGSDINSIQVLAEDVTGLDINNYIQDEMHLQVNVLNNKFLVRPTNGSFYKHDLVVKHNDQVLTIGVDYELVGINLGKTRMSLHPSGVYDYIHILKPIAGGVVSLTYRAFGGMVCPATVNQIKITLANILEYLKSGNFLTYEGLGSHPIITSMLDRIALIENLLHVQAPVTYTYQSGSAVKWSSIANILTSVDRGNCQLRIRCGKYYSDIKLNYDLDADRKLDIQMINSWSSTVESDGMDYFTDRICPKFRLIWDSDDRSAGLVLQMSVTTMETKDLSITIQNYDGPFSTMRLIPVNTVLGNNSNQATLPDGSAWDVLNNNCVASNHVVAYGSGYAVYVGAMPTKVSDSASYTNIILDNNNDNSQPIQTYGEGISVPVRVTGTDIDPSEIAAIGFRIYDRYDGNVINKISGDLSIIGNSVQTSVMYFTEDLCLVQCHFRKLQQGYSLFVGSHTGTHSLINNRFVIQQVDVYFKGGCHV